VNRTLVFAGASGLVAAVALYAYTAALRREAAGGDRTGVLVALRELEKGARLERGDLGIRTIPAGFVHPDAIPESHAERVAGKTLGAAVAAGQPLHWRDVSSTVARKPLAEVVPKGLRALTLPVDVSSSLGGALRGGDRVDLLGTFTRGGDLDRATVTLLQNVLVLVGAEPAAEAPAPDHVTVALTLEEAELVAFALGRGQVHVVLRHARDQTVIERVPEKTFADVLEVERRAAMAGRRTIEQLRGAEP
jgi:pilus assembly protein CpaB